MYSAKCLTYAMSSCFARRILASAILTYSWPDISGLAVWRHEKRDKIFRGRQHWLFDDVTRYLVVGSQRVNTDLEVIAASVFLP